MNNSGFGNLSYNAHIYEVQTIYFAILLMQFNIKRNIKCKKCTICHFNLTMNAFPILNTIVKINFNYYFFLKIKYFNF